MAQETLRKYIYFDDLVWVGLLFHVHIEVGSRFSVGGSRTIEKMHIFWWFGVGGPNFFMFMLKKEVDLVWLAQETLRKHMYFHDFVWVA